MAALMRNATLVTARCPRPNVASRNSASTASFWSPGSAHVLLYAAVAALTTSAAFGAIQMQGTWSTAQLSQARYTFAATSVGTLALFAGGRVGLDSTMILKYIFVVL